MTSVLSFLSGTVKICIEDQWKIDHEFQLAQVTKYIRRLRLCSRFVVGVEIILPKCTIDQNLSPVTFFADLSNLCTCIMS